MLLKMAYSYSNLGVSNEARTKANMALGMAESIREVSVVEECKEFLAHLNANEQPIKAITEWKN